MTPESSLAGVGTSGLLEPIAADLARVEDWLRNGLESGPEELAPLLDHVARFRGKRVRAAQVLWVGRACGGLRSEHVALAGIVELIHAATLAHDDVLDGASERRGLDCLHVGWGDHAAILLGDWLYALAFSRCTVLGDGGMASRALADATLRICRGEIHQNLTRGDFELSETDYLAQIDGKTAALFEVGGRLAARHAGLPEDHPAVAAAAEHGVLAGRAFQIVDDLLDVEGDPAATRKSLGTDWASGKMTLPMIRLRDRLALPERQRLAAAFAARGDLDFLAEEPFATAWREARATCRDEAAALLDAACAALERLPEGDDARHLAALTRFFAQRRS